MNRANESCLEGDHLPLALLVTAELEVLASANALLLSCLALGALHPQGDLLGCLGLRCGGHRLGTWLALDAMQDWIARDRMTQTSQVDWEFVRATMTHHTRVVNNDCES